MNKGFRKLIAMRQDRYRLTDKQKIYLRLLLNEAFAHLYNHGFRLDPHHLDNVPRVEASVAIASLIEAKNRGWK